MAMWRDFISESKAITKQRSQIPSTRINTQALFCDEKMLRFCHAMGEIRRDNEKNFHFPSKKMENI